jgi:hypothetical protein
VNKLEKPAWHKFAKTIGKTLNNDERGGLFAQFFIFHNLRRSKTRD